MLTAILDTLARLMAEVAKMGQQGLSNGNAGGRAGVANCMSLPPPLAPNATSSSTALDADSPRPQSSMLARGDTCSTKGADMSNAGSSAPSVSSTPPHQRGKVGGKSDPARYMRPVAGEGSTSVLAPADAFLALPSRPKLSEGSVPTPITWAGVATANVVRDNGNVQDFVKVARANKPSRPQATTKGKTTRVVVLHDNGIDDQAKEDALRYGNATRSGSREDHLKASAARIVMAVRTAIGLVAHCQAKLSVYPI